MKVLGIGGSPRKGGNTDILLDKALEGAKSAGAEVEKVILNDLDFGPCQECGGCSETGVCVVKDDMGIVYRKLETADAVAIASPVFFGSVSAQIKMMIDRLQCLWVMKHVLNRPFTAKARRKGVFLCVGGARKDVFFENARRLIKIFFGTLGIEYSGEVYYGGFGKNAAIMQEEEALKKAFELGKDLARAT